VLLSGSRRENESKYTLFSKKLFLKHVVKARVVHDLGTKKGDGLFSDE